MLYALAPMAPYMGCVPGQRDTAVNLINAGMEIRNGGRLNCSSSATIGFWTAVIPGGAEEAMKGHESAYKLSWGSRQGFAHVAKQTKCVVRCQSDNSDPVAND